MLYPFFGQFNLFCCILVIREAELQVEVIKRKKQIEVEEAEVSRREKELEATERKPAEYEAVKVELLAGGQRRAKVLLAEAQAQKIRLIGQAEADSIKLIGVANAKSMLMPITQLKAPCSNPIFKLVKLYSKSSPSFPLRTR